MTVSCWSGEVVFLGAGSSVLLMDIIRVEREMYVYVALSSTDACKSPPAVCLRCSLAAF